MSGHDGEIQALKAGVSCAVVLERRGWQLDKRDSTQHCWKYRRGAGEVLIVNHAGRGWWDPTGDRKGDVFALVSTAVRLWISRTFRAVILGSGAHIGGTQTLFESQSCPSTFCP